MLHVVELPPLGKTVNCGVHGLQKSVVVFSNCSPILPTGLHNCYVLAEGWYTRHARLTQSKMKLLYVKFYRGARG